MARKTGKAALSPAAIMDDIMGVWRSRAMVAAVQLKIFDHIAKGKHTAIEIAEASGASQRGITNLLDALTGMGHLRKSGSRYRLTPASAAFLVTGKKPYVGELAHGLSLTWDAWKNLTDSVKSGRPAQTVNVAEKGKEFFPKLVASIFPGNFAASTMAVSRLPQKERDKIRKILDVAAGSGAWSLAFAQAIPQARVTSMDFPEMTPITRSYSEKLGVAGRYEYLEGDLRQVDFGRDMFDLVILGHIVHSEGEKHGKQLLQKSYAALRPGGKLLIGEFVPNDARTAPAMPLLFGLNMLLQTEEGNVFTLREYRTWLKEAGFRKVSTIPVLPPSTVILATK